ncbi:MAG: radical SAM protein [bacterium]|nr:radical SAM protein [bacterium]
MFVELIHPPHSNSTDDRLDPPLGLLLIASYIRKQHPDVLISVNDLSGKKQKDWKIGFADVYGLTVYAPSFSVTKKIISKCKKENPNAKIVVGGAHPSAMPFLFEADADYVVIGEGEKSMSDILTSLKSDAKTILGKIIQSNESVPFLFPAFDLVDLGSYHRTISKIKSVPYLTSRGCPYKCAFCGLSYMHEISKVRFAEPELVFEHLERIKAMGIGAINFQDDNFTMKRDRLFKILALIKPLGLKFRCHGKAGQDDEEVYARLAEAGCTMAQWGCESGSQYMLDRMNKKSKVEDNYKVIQWAKKYGMITRAFFIIGFPGETSKTLDETKKFIAATQPDQYIVSNFVPYPGCSVWRNPKKYGIVKMERDFNKYYQIGRRGYGGLTIDTEWLSRKQFRKLEKDFRQWLKDNIKMKGDILDYEKKLYKSQNE